MTKEQAAAERARLLEQDMRMALDQMDARAYRDMVNAIAEGKPWPPEDHSREFVEAMKAEPKIVPWWRRVTIKLNRSFWG